MNKLLTHYPPESVVHRAYAFARTAYDGKMRVSGEDYFSYCLKVAEMLHDWKLDEPTIAVSLLHNIEHEDFSQEYIEEHFNEEIAFLVDRLHRLKALTYSGKRDQAEYFRKLLIALSQDLRVIFIKLADKLQDMYTLSSLSDSEQQRIAQKAFDLYAPLAYRLGMQKLGGDFKDLAFPYLYPKENAWLRKTVREQFAERQRYVESLTPHVLDILKRESIIPSHIDARAKRYASLYKKLQRYDMDLDKIYDLVALRIIVDTVEDCYRVLGTIHEHWEPLPERIKDYIARPKLNGYRSLHTTVRCIDGRITEIQIRTNEMHEEAELGAAAHWMYQQSKGTKDYFLRKSVRPDERELLWVRQLSNWQEQFKSYEDFLESVKRNFFTDQIFVITPKNDVVDLPIDATPVDFAYRIHSEVGDSCVGVKVNQQNVSLDHILKSGDVVKILTQNGKQPSEAWLGFVKTSMARDRIKAAQRAKINLLKERGRASR